MKSLVTGLLLLVLSLTSMAVQSESFDLASVIEKSGDSIEFETQGYAKLNLFRFNTNHRGKISLKGSFSIEKGTANVVMWSRVQGRYYFSKLPALQGFGSTAFTNFSIPFTSPDQPITEVIVNVELPNGGELTIKSIELIKD